MARFVLTRRAAPLALGLLGFLMALPASAWVAASWRSFDGAIHDGAFSYHSSTPAIVGCHHGLPGLAPPCCASGTGVTVVGVFGPVTVGATFAGTPATLGVAPTFTTETPSLLPPSSVVLAPAAAPAALGLPPPLAGAIGCTHVSRAPSSCRAPGEGSGLSLTMTRDDGTLVIVSVGSPGAATGHRGCTWRTWPALPADAPGAQVVAARH